MNKRVDVVGNIEGKRYFSLPGAATVCSLGKTTMRRLAEETGAIRRVGRRVLVDMTVIENALDQKGKKEG